MIMAKQSTTTSASDGQHKSIEDLGHELYHQNTLVRGIFAALDVLVHEHDQDQDYRVKCAVAALVLIGGEMMEDTDKRIHEITQRANQEARPRAVA
jgi:hypothetical protein